MRERLWLPICLALALVGATPAAASGLSDFAGKYELAKIVPGATRLGPIEGTPPSAVAYDGNKALGFVFLNSTAASSIGYSGRPIHVVVGVDKDGVITGARMVKHFEPIVLIGIPVKRIHDFIDGYVGVNVVDFVERKGAGREIDIVSGATVTVLVIEDSIIRSAIKVLRQRGVGEATAKTAERLELKELPAEQRDWATLLGDGSVRRLTLGLGDVNRAFEASANKEAAARPEEGAPDEVFIDLFAAQASIPTIGESLLGPREYRNLESIAEPGQSAILIAGRGRYSFKGSGYVRGGIFDRIQLIQGDISVRFRDKFHKRIGEFQADGAERFSEIGLFLIPTDSGFDPARPWRLQLLVQRAVGPIKKAFTTFELNYRLPEAFVTRTAPPAKTATSSASPSVTLPADEAEAMPLWRKIWEGKVFDIAVLMLALGVLTVIFFFQDWLTKHPKLTLRIRIAFLTFTLLWIGFYANAQLSVVNTLTFFNALLTGFRWEFFLMEPLIFILWGSVAASLLFWGRGVYCGWLCPFGALQELTNKLARRLRVPQLTLPWALHERMWPVKYILFLGILGFSLYSFELAEKASEVEPFKTAIILKFQRSWPFVLFAVGVIAIGLFIERFYCRYLCPLGGALGIPGRMRMNDWLRRYKECGSPCLRCHNECMVQAIHPEGHINPNECLQCLHCQVLYSDDQKCPVMIQRRLKRERRQALRSKSLDLPADTRRGEVQENQETTSTEREAETHVAAC
ncbi:MAG: 4Fe-4S binding protein [Alphaproteobacteria bacterium]|nr:4Fe-4S binding protein [Alphaproteobacteria bacterium]